MKKAAVWAVCAALALATLFVCMDSAAQLRHAAPVFAREDRVTVVIDAGHGGEDGGASSPFRRSGEYDQSGDCEENRGPAAFCGRADADDPDAGRFRLHRGRQHPAEEGIGSQKPRADGRAHAECAALSIHQNYFPEAKYHGRAGVLREDAGKRGAGSAAAADAAHMRGPGEPPARKSLRKRSI